VVDRFTKELVRERIDNGHFDVRNMSFAKMEMLSQQIGRRVAQHLGQQMTSRQSELYLDDDCCPMCGLECEPVYRTRTHRVFVLNILRAIRRRRAVTACRSYRPRLRTIYSIDGETEVVELRCFCHQCRRYSFPCA
jgi:hypothetical protein